MLPMIDIHAHLPERDKTSCAHQREEIELRHKNHIITCFSCGSPKEWDEMQRFGDRADVSVTFGVHPWFAHELRVEDCGDLFRRCAAVGEIGLDGFLSEAPLEKQKKVFEKQLTIAADLQKPVVIHCDGREKETEEMLRDFPGKILMHWFNGDRAVLEKLLQKDCYFSLGPDTDLIMEGRPVLGDEARHEARKFLVSEVKLDRVFAESDGLEAVAWARGEEVMPPQILPNILQKTVTCFASVRGVGEASVKAQMAENFHHFFK